ncbi:hypothetical protein LMG9673_04716 [Ralstonia pseudosolanacearum]|nr:hypothetical protein LMG9673_04716 [Ralstonia pseudosolanacearum]
MTVCRPFFRSGISTTDKCGGGGCGADGREHRGVHDRPLASFKRHYRKVEGVKRGADVPIAVLVPRVVLRKLFDMDQLVARRIPRLPVAGEAAIRPAH